MTGLYRKSAVTAIAVMTCLSQAGWADDRDD